MKQLDNTKIIDQNTKLENDLANERNEWKGKVIELINMMKDNKKLSEAQVVLQLQCPWEGKLP